MTSIVSIVHEVEDDYNRDYAKIPENEPRLVKARRMLSSESNNKKNLRPIYRVDHTTTEEEKHKIYKGWLNLETDKKMAIDMTLTMNQVAIVRREFGKANRLVWKFTKDGICICKPKMNEFKGLLKLDYYTNTDWVVERAEKLGYTVTREISHDY